MGALQAQEMAGLASLEQGLTWHLTSNHYPPVPVSMVPVCIAAIDAYNEGDVHRAVKLPDGVSWCGDTYAPAWAIIEQHHLDAWVADDDEEWDESNYNNEEEDES